MTQPNDLVRLAADVGGTFTDIVLDTPRGFFTAKVPTNIPQPEQGILDGIQIVLRKANITAGEVDTLIHGTTLATNALIERKGAKTALITTQGFRDSIEIGYENRFDQYDLMIDKPTPLVPRKRRFTVPERMNVHGEVLTELDHDAVRALIPELKNDNIEAIAIGLLHSYVNPAHEQAIRDILIDNGCSATISLSSEVCPEVREYERLMTTVCNSYVQPIMSRYLQALKTALGDQGFRCVLFLMTSGGGMTTLESAIRFPIRLVESGPSGGAILATGIAANIREKHVLSFDMGGTTAKICLIDDYQPKTARNFEIARSARFQKGSGMPVRIPVVEMIEIGAGGGSIANVDSLGRLAIGPESAGSVPGPSCYRKGGSHATVTDVDLLLGKIDADSFAEGKMPLDTAAANESVIRDIANPLDISVLDAAYGVNEMVEENMANAARIHSVEHGSDLTRATMIAFGGAGPLHACGLAEKLNVKRVIVPDNSGVGSAVGFLWAPMAYEVVRSFYMTLEKFDAGEVNRVFSELAEEAYGIVRSGAPDAELSEVRTAFMRYVGQGHEIEVPVPSGALTRGKSAQGQLTDQDYKVIQSNYESAYRQLYGRTIPERDIEILSWSLVVSSEKKISEGAIAAELADRPITSTQWRRCVQRDTHDYQQTPVFWRDDLAVGDSFDGPALVAEAQTTTFVSANFRAHIDSQHNLVLDRVSL